MAEPSSEITSLLRQLSRGEEQALESLLPLVYAELRDRAAVCMRRERRDHTLQPTALVHEAYLRLVRQDDVAWEDRSHFLAIGARLMRQILIEHARARSARKRQGERERVPLTAGMLSDRAEIDILEIDEALTRLSGYDERMARVVELRFFGGLSVEETALVLGVDARTVKRDWRVARTWLLDALGGRESGS